MGLLYILLIVANVFFIVYYRLMIHFETPGTDPSQRAGIGVVLSVPQRASAGSGDGRYRKRYWTACATLGVLLLIGVLWRGPHIAAQFAG